ncbi:MAG: hypothetical protein ACLUFT_12875 [Gemmiger formicilis]
MARITSSGCPEIIERHELANVDVTITIIKTAKAVDPDAVRHTSMCS